MDLYQTFKRSTGEQQLLGPGSKILLAVSGGLDSMVMTALCHRLAKEIPGRYFFGIAHVNFQLRGAESDADEQLVQDFAQQLGWPCWCQHFDTRSFAATEGISIQMAARSLRYEWFEQLRTAHDFEAVATAHHQNDNLETVLLNFTRGTGLAGLCGIPIRQEHLIRPMVFATREEIYQYALENDLVWREDSSNETDDYARNFVRHQVVPRLESLNPALVKGTERTTARLKGVWTNYQVLLEEWRKAFLEKTDETHVRLKKTVLDIFPDKASMLHDLLAPFELEEEQARQLADNWFKTGREWKTPTGWRVLNDRQHLYISTESASNESIAVAADDMMLTLPDGKRLVLMPCTPAGPFPDGRQMLMIDAGKLQFPLILRRWKEGDVFLPFGMNGKKQRLQDFFVNQKLSRQEKEQVWVLVNGDGAIIWLPGYRSDDRFKITSDTVQALKISLVE